MNIVETQTAIRDAATALSKVGPGGGGSLHPAREISELDDQDLRRFCVFGWAATRRKVIMELAMRHAEKGGKPFILAPGGGYAPLVGYMPQLRTYEIGRNSTLNVFAKPLRLKGYSAVLSDIVGSIFSLTRDERGYFMRGIEMAYADGLVAPSMREIGDRLLQLQAEVQPKEAYKIECLKNALWELESGGIGAMSELAETRFNLPAVLDLEPVTTWRERALASYVLMLRSLDADSTLLVVDPADWLVRGMHAGEGSTFLLEWLESAAGQGKGVCLGMRSAGVREGWLTDLTCAILTGPVWGEGFGPAAGARRGGSGKGMTARGVEEGFSLVWRAAAGEPFLVRETDLSFEPLGPAETLEHMRILGEDVKPLTLSAAKRERMLEKIFPDRSALVYAWEVLRLVQSGRVAVESVVRQKNAAIKAVVRTLKRYFMIVECTDSTGSGCYRLTKAGERAISEMEGGVEGDKGKTSGT